MTQKCPECGWNYVQEDSHGDPVLEGPCICSYGEPPEN
jgi:hypothetical protein